jgi:hypothetical protein
MSPVLLVEGGRSVVLVFAKSTNDELPTTDALHQNNAKKAATPVNAESAPPSITPQGSHPHLRILDIYQLTLSPQSHLKILQWPSHQEEGAVVLGIEEVEEAPAVRVAGLGVHADLSGVDAAVLVDSTAGEVVVAPLVEHHAVDVVEPEQEVERQYLTPNIEFKLTVL